MAKKTVTVEFDIDEWYPVFSLELVTDPKDTYGLYPPLEVSSVFMTRYRRIFEQFDQLQMELLKMMKEHEKKHDA